MDLSETYSNNYKIIRDFVKSHVTTPVNSSIEQCINNTPYDPNCIVKSIKQQQKNLSELEIQTICKKYQSGSSSYELAKEFSCHRSTITAALRRNGIEVSHRATTKPELVKRVIELYKKYWLKIEANAGDADSVVDFINRYLTLFLSDKINKGSEYRTFKKRIDRMFGDFENPYETAMMSLCHFSKYYKWIKHPEAIAEISPKVSEIFSNLNEIGNEYAIPALMFMSEKADNPNSVFDFDGLARASSYIEDWLFRARITRNITTGAVGQVLSGLVQLITKKAQSLFLWDAGRGIKQMN